MTEWVQKVGGRSRLALDFARANRHSSPTTANVSCGASDVNTNEDFCSYILSILAERDAEMEEADARDDSSKYVAAIESGKLRYLDKERAMEWAKLERDRVSKLLTTNQASHGSEGIIKGGRSAVKGENAPFAIFSELLAREEADTVAVAYAAAPVEIMWMPEGVHVICATVNGEPGRRRE